MVGALDALFKPRSVALVGASANPSKLGNVVLRNLLHGRFKIYPVNPRESEILGLPCYRSVLDIEGPVDLALVSVPAQSALAPVRECVKKGVDVAIVTSSGFRESGPAGAELERSLVEAVQGSKTRLLGPNTMGVFVPSRRLDTLLIPKDKSRRPRRGGIAMLSQSGAISVSFLERAAASGLGVSACVGLGNKADIEENNLIEYLGDDPATRCIALYLESFADGAGFLTAAGRISADKPIVLLKAGRTAAGSHAASSHTGAIASSSDALIDDVLRQAGVARAYDEEELIDIAKALSLTGSIRGDRICVVASAGGYGVVAADYVESKERGAGLRMAQLSPETRSELEKVIPEFSSTSNPVDLTAGVTDAMYDAVLGLLQRDPGVDGIMMSLELQPPNVTSKLVEITERRAISEGAPIVVSAFGGERTSALIRVLERRGVLAYPTIWRAVRALQALAERGAYLKRRKTRSEDPR
ncbi:MAG: CoA-binding protein [Candidatus Thermoplasmatota archaeon]|nr:CoA-binding protein [Candidatus Thermoplasmatota archaeon]